MRRMLISGSSGGFGVSSTKVYTLRECSRLLGCSITIIRGLIVHHEIPVQKAGQAYVVDQNGFDRLERAVKEWKSLPRICELGLKPLVPVS